MISSTASPPSSPATRSTLTAPFSTPSSAPRFFSSSSIYISSFFFLITSILYCKHRSAFHYLLQEGIVLPPFVALAIRPRPGVWEYVRVNVHELIVEQLQVSEYLQFKEKLVDEN